MRLNTYLNLRQRVVGEEVEESNQSARWQQGVEKLQLEELDQERKIKRIKNQILSKKRMNKKYKSQSLEGRQDQEQLRLNHQAQLFLASKVNMKKIIKKKKNQLVKREPRKALHLPLNLRQTKVRRKENNLQQPRKVDQLRKAQLQNLLRAN